jgi:hypothetical protein
MHWRTPSPASVTSHVQRDSIKPRRKRSRFSISGPCQEHTQENFLAQIRNAIISADDSRQEASDRLLPATDQGDEGGRITVLPGRRGSIGEFSAARLAAALGPRGILARRNVVHRALLIERSRGVVARKKIWIFDDFRADPLACDWDAGHSDPMAQVPGRSMIALGLSEELAKMVLNHRGSRQ